LLVARPKAQVTQTLNAFYLPKDFVVDDLPIQPTDELKKWITAFEGDKYSALFQLGFNKKEPWFSPSLEYLHHLARTLARNFQFKQQQVKVVA
jgi:non-specific serine/threonine protein kinase